MFVTINIGGATATDISVYDNWVSADANADAALFALGTTWHVVASTQTVSAYDHIGGNFTIPVYNLQGQLLATGAADLWDGSIDAPVLYDEHGNAASGSPHNVWTGSTAQGGIYSGQYLGASPFVEAGEVNNTSSAWIDAGFGTADGGTYRLFGISGTLTVPAAAPEPATIELLALALVGMGCRHAKSRLRKKRTTQ
jgi:hypothetical protein